MSDHATTIDALRRGAAPEALAAAREAVAAQPDDATAQRLLAAALRLSGEREAALEAIDRAIDLAPDDANLHLERAGLMLDGRKLDEAEASLARSVGLDPNQFPAYIIQGQLALGRGDLDEAERLTRTAARMAPEHPQVAALEGMLALRKGDPDRALGVLSRASERSPNVPQVQHALGFAYLAKGHLAFAEQAFRKLLERDDTSRALRALLADLLRRQNRPAEAADMLVPLLERDDAPPALMRLVGEIDLLAGRNEQALGHLKRALALRPDDRRTLVATIEAWRRLDAADEARSVLDAALATHPESVDLWHARLAFEPMLGGGAQEVVARWQQAMPDFIPALEAQSALHDHAGDTEAADALAHRIVELQPGHTQAELRIVNRLRRDEPAAAVARLEAHIDKASDPRIKRNLRNLLGHAHESAGDPGQAITTWSALHADVVNQRLPLPAHVGAPDRLPALAPLPEPAPGVLFLWGPPGSLVERVALTFELAGGPLNSDRLGSQPPVDFLQRFDSAQALRDGSLDPAATIAQWRDALPARGRRDSNIFDWLLWWDNAFLAALRPHLPEALLLVVLRDPRDMLLDWLAFGGPVPYALPSPAEGARWLAAGLEQVATLHEGDLFPHRLVRLDGIETDSAAIAKAVAESLDIPLPAAQQGQLGAPHFPAGHWRAYAEPLAEAFAVLTPVARRLGYPEA